MKIYFENKDFQKSKLHETKKKIKDFLEKVKKKQVLINARGRAGARYARSSETKKYIFSVFCSERALTFILKYSLNERRRFLRGLKVKVI